jgi:hypothetical protein
MKINSSHTMVAWCDIALNMKIEVKFGQLNLSAAAGRGHRTSKWWFDLQLWS